jgi:hypothetical protein
VRETLIKGHTEAQINASERSGGALLDSEADALDLALEASCVVRVAADVGKRKEV